MISSFVINSKIDHFVYLKSCLSTNDYANTIASKSNPDDHIAIYSFNQQEGKGQIGRKWYTGSNQNIAFSLVLKLNQFPVTKSQYLNYWISLCVHDFILSLDPEIQDLKIKWPNDIYIKNEKLCGLLIQTQLSGKFSKSAIIGIGMNVNEMVFPKTLPNPCSLFQQTGKKYDLVSLVHQLSDFIAKRMKMLDHLHFDKIKFDYQKNMYLKNENHTFSLPEGKGKITGKILGVNQEGHLLIKTFSDILSFKFREITY